jgi:hypothetical protein
MGGHSGVVFHHAKNAGLRQFESHLQNIGSSTKIRTIVSVWVGTPRRSGGCRLRVHANCVLDDPNIRKALRVNTPTFFDRLNFLRAAPTQDLVI